MFKSNKQLLENQNVYYGRHHELTKYLGLIEVKMPTIVDVKKSSCAIFRKVKNAYYCRQMKPQDYIDYKLNELPHKICKHYCMYSPKEKTAYKERFPNCGCVEIIKYSDGSQGSKCPYGAFGDKDGNIDLNISDKCYMCTHYKSRRGDIKVVNEGTIEYYENEKDRLIHMIQYAENGLNELEIGLPQSHWF